MSKRIAQITAMRIVLDILQSVQRDYGDWPTTWPGVWGESEAYTADEIAKAAEEGLLNKRR